MHLHIMFFLVSKDSIVLWSSNIDTKEDFLEDFHEQFF